MSPSHVLKILLIGPGAVGKTSLLKRFIDNEFREDYKLTIGVDFLAKKVKTNEFSAKLTIWDIGGQESFQFMRPGFYGGAHGALVVFDLSRAATFDQIKEWIRELHQFAGNVPFVLIGNKFDLIEDVGLVIDRNEAKNLAKQFGSFYIETSAKTGVNVEEAFVALTSFVINRQ